MQETVQGTKMCAFIGRNWRNVTAIRIISLNNTVSFTWVIKGVAKDYIKKIRVIHYQMSWKHKGKHIFS